MNPIQVLIGRFQSVIALAVLAIAVMTVAVSEPLSAHEGRNVGEYNLVVGFLHEPTYEGHLNAVSLVVTGEAEQESDDDHDHDHDDHDHAHSAKTMDFDVADAMVSVDAMTRDAVSASHGLGFESGENQPIMFMEGAQTTARLNASDATRRRVTGLASTLQVEVTHLATDVSKEMPLTELIDDPGHYIAEFVPTAPGEYRMRFVGTIEGNAIDETFDAGPDTFDTVVPSDAIQFPVVLESNREIRNAAQGALDSVQQLETDLDAAESTARTGTIIGIVGTGFGLVSIIVSIIAVTIARRRNPS